MKSVAIITPCYNEEKLIELFLRNLAEELKRYDNQINFDIVVVDDASTDGVLEKLKSINSLSGNTSIHVISLFYNMGHQEAIRQGLLYVGSLNKEYHGVIVMDSDGEDDPSAIHKLLSIENFDIIFVERGKRSENLSFKIGYYLYKTLFRIVTTKKITFGNYSMISGRVLKSVQHQKFFHYSGFLSKTRFSIQKVRHDRLKRLDGKSKMSYKGLVFHGLYSLVEYSEEILFTLLKLFGLLTVGITGIGAHMFYSKYIVRQAPYGWTSTIAVSLLISALIIISTIIICLLQIAIKRSLNQKDIQFTRQIKNTIE